MKPEDMNRADLLGYIGELESTNEILLSGASALSELNSILGNKNEKLKSRIEKLRGALETLWAAVGDRFLAKQPLSKAYAQSVSSEITKALAADKEQENK